MPLYLKVLVRVLAGVVVLRAVKWFVIISLVIGVSAVFALDALLSVVRIVPLYVKLNVVRYVLLYVIQTVRTTAIRLA